MIDGEVGAPGGTGDATDVPAKGVDTYSAVTVRLNRFMRLVPWFLAVFIPVFLLSAGPDAARQGPVSAAFLAVIGLNGLFIVWWMILRQPTAITLRAGQLIFERRLGKPIVEPIASLVTVRRPRGDFVGNETLWVFRDRKVRTASQFMGLVQLVAAIAAEVPEASIEI